MSLIRFDDSSRGPSAQLWRGLVDWVSGSLMTALGQRDFEDYQPDNSGNETVTSTTGSPTRSVVTTEPFGVVNYTESAGTHECISVVRHLYYTLADAILTVVEARVRQNADADSPQMFVGFFDGTLAFASGALDGGSGEDTIGLRWNADETIDIVAVDNGTLTVLKDDIGVTVERTSGYVSMGLRIERVTSTQSRLEPCINKVNVRTGAVNVLNTLLPENPMRPCVATSVAATTAPSIDVDFIYSAQQ